MILKIGSVEKQVRKNLTQQSLTEHVLRWGHYVKRYDGAYWASFGTGLGPKVWLMVDSRSGPNWTSWESLLK